VTHPVVVEIASLVPGLGFLILGQPRKALYIWAALLTCALVYLFSPFEFLWDVAAIAFVGLWFLQIVWAGREAGIKRRIASGQVSEAKEVAALAPPPGLSRVDRYLFGLRETIKAQVRMGEQVGPVASAMDRSRASIYSGVYTLGVVDSGLVIVQMSMGNKPKSVERIEADKINRVEFKQGVLTDRIRIHISDRKRPLQLYSQRAFREQMQAVASALAAGQSELK
jgi:hypothetical protein